MAATWIKMRSNLWDDPRVSRLCDLLELGEAAIIGGLYRLWSIADEHSADGRLPGMTPQSLDRKTGIPGFADAVVNVGWLESSAGEIIIPRFDEHNGPSAKKRAQAANRQQTHRDRTPADPPPRAEHPPECPAANNAPTPPAAEELPPKLAELINEWNAMPAGIAPRVQNRTAEAIRKGWEAMQKSSEARAYFADPAALMAKIRGSPFLHGQSWFRLPWLFARGKTREWNIVKVMEGAYVDGNGKAAAIGPGQRHESDRAGDTDADLGL